MATLTKGETISNFKKALDEILSKNEPPVARCRLLSGGFEPYHRLDILEELQGDRGCLACGNCIDSCPIVRRDPERQDKTPQRTSMALESIVNTDCEKCYSCILSCPQVSPEIKDYIVEEKIIEVIPQSKILRFLDNYLAVIFAFILGLIIGLFLRV